MLQILAKITIIPTISMVDVDSIQSVNVTNTVETVFITLSCVNIGLF